MIEDIIYKKEKLLLKKKREVDEKYDNADEETKRIYDMILELIQMELKLIYQYIPEKENSKTR